MTPLVSQSLLDALANDEQKRRRRIHDAWEAYHGDHDPSLAVRDGETDDNVTVNLSRLVVDAGVDALYGQAPQWTTGDDAHDAAVDAWHSRRRTQTGATSPFLLTLQKLALNGAVTGHPFVKWSVRKDDPTPRLRVLDPANVTAYWEEDDHEAVYAYKIEWATVNQHGKPAVRRQMIERDGDAWTIRDEERVGGYGKWTVLRTEQWPYPWAPIAGTQNLPCPNEHYGLADLEDDHLALQAAVNYSASNINRIIRLYAHPRDVGYGFTAGELQMAPGQMLTLPSPSARIDTLPMASDLSSSLEFFARLREAMHATTQTPEVAIGKMQDVGAMSGVALSILWGPLVRKTEKKRLTYGPLVEDAIRQYLVLVGAASDVDAVEVETTWPEIVPVNVKEERETAAIDHALGVSRATILANLGYDPEEEAAQRAGEDAASDARRDRMFNAGQTVDAATSADATTDAQG